METSGGLFQGQTITVSPAGPLTDEAKAEDIRAVEADGIMSIGMGMYCQPIFTPTWTGVGLSPGLPALCRVTIFVSSFAFRVWEWVPLFA